MTSRIKLSMGYAIGLLCVALSSTANAQDTYTKELVAAEKERILYLAELARGSEDDDGSIRAQLDEAVNNLLAITPEQPIEERLKKLPGAWEQVWGPYSYGGPFNIKLDADNIYQVIFPEGYYYNIGFSDFLGNTNTGFLRGEYQVSGDGIQIRFVKNAILPKKLPSGVNLESIAKLRENNVIAVLPLPLSERAKEGGNLTESYIDDTLRISYGGRPSNPREDLYILKRIVNTK